MIQFQYPLAALMIIPAILSILYYTRPKGSKAVILVSTGLLIISIIIFSIASPYTEEFVEGISGRTDVTIVDDRTESMRLFAPSDDVYAFLSNRTETSLDYISGTKSPIGDAIIRNSKSGGSILLISDGNNNEGRSIPEAVSFARSLNTTVYYLRQEPVKKDMGVSIEGDAVAVAGTRADFSANVMSTGKIKGDLNIWIDGKAVLSDRVTGEMKIPFTYSFDVVGSHTIKAELTAEDDEFPRNNVFYRTVHVMPRPGILLVSNEDSPLSRILEQSYSVHTATTIGNLSGYKAVVLDDMSAAGLTYSDSLALSDHVMNGGGLVVVGGSSAFSDYSRMPLLEQLMPVRYGGIPPAALKTAVVLVVDISGSTGEFSGSDLKLGIEKGLAVQVLDDLGEGDFTGVIAFNNAPHTVLPFAQHSARSEAKEAILGLRYGGTTRLLPALAAAQELLKDFKGGRNIIVISDGVVLDGEASLNTARLMSDDGITIYAIGVGGDTDEEFMRNLALAGGGGYLRRDAAHGIRILLGEKERRDRGEGYQLLIIDSDHFITEDATLNATVYGYNNVLAKKNAQALVMTGSGNPVITSWRAGLGRVVAITVDNGNAWAPALYGAGNSAIITRSVNYAVGNPDGLDLQAPDGEIGRPLDIMVSSGSEPVLAFDGSVLRFERTGENQFHTVIYPNSTGFHDLSGYAIAVNEPSEYRDTGNNELLPAIITAAGGRIYDRSGLERLVPDITAQKTGTVRQVTDLRPVFLMAALILYTIFVVFRRLAEIMRPS